MPLLMSQSNGADNCRLCIHVGRHDNDDTKRHMIIFSPFRTALLALELTAMKGDIYIHDNYFYDNFIAIGHYFYDNYIIIDNYFDNNYFHDHHFADI